jgi:transcriptional regulator with XRE-family HTH domain
MDASGVRSPTLKRLLNNLKLLRQAKQLTQEGFAEFAGLSYKYYQAVETGKKPDLRLSTLERLAKAHGLEVSELLSPMTTRDKAKPRKKS